MSAVEGIDQHFLGGGGALFVLRDLEGVEDAAPLLRLIDDARHLGGKQFGVKPREGNTWKIA